MFLFHDGTRGRVGGFSRRAFTHYFRPEALDGCRDPENFRRESVAASPAGGNTLVGRRFRG